MAADRAEILADIHDERERQDAQWGHDFDDRNTVNDWCTYIARYASDAAFAIPVDPDQHQYNQRRALVKTAALAVAALEAFDRNDGFPDRHYDKR